MSDWNKDYSDALVENLSRQGYATWSIEYRRLGNAGGGFPGTYLDVSRAADFVATLSKKYRLDLGRVTAVGHSAGGIWHCGWQGAATSRRPARSRRRGPRSTSAAWSSWRAYPRWRMRWRNRGGDPRCRSSE
ncbi:alpha/beta hydrolase [Rhizorhabdus histidinilytica]